MKKLASFLLAFSLLTSVFAQMRPKVSRATIFFDGKNISQLARLGLECDHGDLRAGHSLTSDFTDDELRDAEKAGFRTEILIDDVVQFYKNQNKQLVSNERGGSCNPGLDALWPIPTHWQYGSMGGFLTLDEAFAQLELMQQLYPNLVSAKKTISDTILTHDGNSIYSVIISDNVSIDEGENQVLYSALHHAREPEGLSQLIFFMWYLLEHYGQDAEITNLVDNLELHFVPILNPDGYLFNQSTDPDGGGYWRKNRRDNGSPDCFGVDLNRNYGYQWGYDDIGSSPDPCSGIYRGPEAFSEPETRSMREYCDAHDFKIALNYHTYGNLLIHPWGYADQPTPDQPVFSRIVNWIGRKNNYKAGLASQTVNYQVNGTSDDWMYGEQATKPKIYALTPEVGKTGFWPSFDEIVPLAQGTMWQNITTAKFALNAAEYEDKSEAYLPNSLSGTLPFELHFLGLEPTTFSVFVKKLSSNIASVSGAQLVSFALNDLSETGSFSYTLNPSINVGDEILFEYTVDDAGGNFIRADTLRKIFGGELQPVFSSPISNMTGWSSTGGNTWTTTTEAFKSAPVSFHDSPGGPYSENKKNVLTSTATINLPTVFLKARLRFWTKWRIEANYDFAQVICNEMPLCGIYTRPGSGFQNPGEPLFDGFQNEWVEESMDLAMFAGQALTFKFTMESDGFTEEDGFFFDDFNVEVVLEDGSIQTTQLEIDDFKMTLQPNPATGSTTISWNERNASNLLVFNGLGQKTRQFELKNPPQTSLEIDLTDWQPGLYFYQLETAAGRSGLQKLVVGR